MDADEEFARRLQAELDPARPDLLDSDAACAKALYEEELVSALPLAGGNMENGQRSLASGCVHLSAGRVCTGGSECKAGQRRLGKHPSAGRSSLCSSSARAILLCCCDFGATTG